MTVDEPFRSYGDAWDRWESGKGDRLRWFPNQVAELGEKELLSRLAGLGVAAARERVIEETADMVAGWQLGEAWCALARASRTLDRDDQDLIRVGAVQLWMRVLPDRPCMELIDDWIAEGDEALGACGDRTAGAAIEAWNRALRCLKEDHITPDMTSTAQLAQRLPSRHELGCWLAEMAEACRWATATSVARGAEGLAFTEWALCTWTDEELPIRERLRSARCMIHWALGERDTAVHLFEAWIAEAPERAAPLVGLGEVLSFAGSPLNDLERAVALLERAAKSEGTEGLDVEVHLDNAVHDMNLVRAKPDIARRWNALPGSQ